MQSDVITIKPFDAQLIIDYANGLGGEQAIEDCAYLCETSTDEEARGAASQSLMTFYANVRSLVRLINTNLNVKQ